MLVFTLEVKLYAPFVHSLKEKRMIIRSLSAKLRNKFNISVSEVDEHDTHQTVVFGIAGVTNETSQADRIMDTILNFMEENTEAEIIDVIRELI